MNQFDTTVASANFATLKAVQAAAPEAARILEENPTVDPEEFARRLAAEVAVFLNKAGSKYHYRVTAGLIKALKEKGLNVTHKDIAACAFAVVGMRTFAVCENPTEAREVVAAMGKRLFKPSRHNFGSYILVC